MKKLFSKQNLSSLFFYISILIFIIGFNFSDTPLPTGWYQQFLPNIGNRQIQDIIFLDSLTGYASARQTGDTSYILKTTDCGDNWNIIYRNFFAMTQIQFLNVNTGYCVGAYLYKTTNGGFNWNQITAPAISPVELYVLNQDTIWIISSEPLTGGVYRTTNGGVSWQQQAALGNQNPNHIYFYNARLGFIAKDNVYLRRTTDAGLSWTLINGAGGFLDMYFTDSLTGWKTSVQKTTDGGLNWVNQVLPSGGLIITSDIVKFSNINKDTIWGVGGWMQYPNLQQRGILYRTTNTGTNWLAQVPDTSIHIFRYYHNQFINRMNGWAYSPVSGIHTTTGGDTIFFVPIHQISSETPKYFVLMQNYPNPFNPVTKIKFSLKNIHGKTQSVKLIVYDITGKETALLLSKDLKAGTYEIEFNGYNYSSGVYFYSLVIDGKKIDTKSMILLK